MTSFNEGKPYHGSDVVQDGNLEGATGETDYFYFFCPQCPDRHILRILDYEVRDEKKENEYNEFFKVKAKRGFTLAFKLYCENCQHTDFVKLSNMGWQGGKHAEILERYSHNRKESEVET